MTTAHVKVGHFPYHLGMTDIEILLPYPVDTATSTSIVTRV